MVCKTKPLASRLRHKVTVQQVTETRDAVGDPIETWSTFAVRRAAIEPLNGREYFNSRQRDSEVSVRIRMRYLSGITTKMRILFGTRVYDIESVIVPEERNVETILMCSENA